MADAKDFFPMVQCFIGENFSVWKFQMSLIFSSHDLLVAAWIKRDMTASTILVHKIDQDIIKTLVGCTTSAEIWSNLNMLQDKQASQSIDKLQWQFFELKFSQKSSCYDLISSITLLVSQLKNLGDTTFNERAIMTRILSSLPKTYNPLITAWNLLPKAQQSLETLKLKLLEEEECLNDQNKVKEETKAFTAWSLSRTRNTNAGISGRHVPASTLPSGRNLYASGSGERHVPPINVYNVLTSSGRPPSHLGGSGGSTYTNTTSSSNTDSQPPLSYE
jgi:hypothetical protein